MHQILSNPPAEESLRNARTISPAKPKTLVLIPARGGSKGIYKKNIRPLGGLPLIAYSINVARQASLVGRVVVSTDDETIAAVAREHGAETPFLRPASLATDNALIGHTVEHALQTLRSQGYTPEATAVLYPTHPFRTPATLDFLIDKLLRGYSPVLTLKAVDCARRNYATIGEDGRLRPIVPTERGLGMKKIMYYRKNGLFTGFLFRFANNPYAYVIRNPLSVIDIDSEKDLALAEWVLREGGFDFKGGMA